MGNRKYGRNNVLYGFHRNTNGASVTLDKVDKPRRSNSAVVVTVKKNTKRT